MRGGNALRFLRYTAVRAVTQGLAVVVALYLTILIVNMGGRLDDIRRSEIRLAVATSITTNPANAELPPSVINQMIEERTQLEYRRLGLDRNFFIRSFDYLTTALSLSLGRAENLFSDSGSREVRRIIAERLPSTLILFGTANLIIFFGTLWVGLALSRRYGTWVDRLVVSLAPTSAAPGWFYGIFLLLIFAAVLRVLPWGGMVSAPPPENRWLYAASVLQHMILPVTAMVLGSFFSGAYGRRTFFLIFSSEDYVDLAKAKGLSSRALQNRYILRPTLPTIIAGFVLMVIGLWFGAIILETVFNWPGVGRLYYQATQSSDTPVVVGVMVVYGYLLAISVFMLDFIYGIVDPRVRVTGGTQRRL